MATCKVLVVVTRVYAVRGVGGGIEARLCCVSMQTCKKLSAAECRAAAVTQHSRHHTGSGLVL